MARAGAMPKRAPEKRKVAGSIPALATILYLHKHGSSTRWIVLFVRFLSGLITRVVGLGLVVVQLVEVGGDMGEFVRVEVAVDVVGGDGGRGMAHGLLHVAQICPGPAGQTGVRVAQVMNGQRYEMGGFQSLVPVHVPAPVVRAQ